jgi:hypothetical protein
LIHQITVHGEVIRAIGQDLGLPVENAIDVQALRNAHQNDTQPDWFDKGAPDIPINRKADIASYAPGDRANMTVATQDRAEGKYGV